MTAIFAIRASVWNRKPGGGSTSSRSDARRPLPAAPLQSAGRPGGTVNTADLPFGIGIECFQQISGEVFSIGSDFVRGRCLSRISWSFTKAAAAISLFRPGC